MVCDPMIACWIFHLPSRTWQVPSCRKKKARPRWSRLCASVYRKLCGAVVRMMCVMTVMTMVGSGKCGRSSRYQHHNKKSQGGLPHASFISRTPEEWQDNIVCMYLTLRMRTQGAQRRGKPLGQRGLL